MSKLLFSDKEQTVGVNVIAYSDSFFSNDTTLSFLVAANMSNSALAADLNALQTQNTVYRISTMQANPAPLEFFPSVYEYRDEYRGTVLYLVANYILVIKVRPALYESVKGIGTVGLYPELSTEFMPLRSTLADDFLTVPAYLVIDSNFLLFQNPEEKESDYVKLNDSEVEDLFRVDRVNVSNLTRQELKMYHHSASCLEPYRKIVMKRATDMTIKSGTKNMKVKAFGLKNKPLLLYSNVIPRSLLTGFTKVKNFTEMINYGKSIGVYDPIEASAVAPNNTFSTYKLSDFKSSILNPNMFMSVSKFVSIITNMTSMPVKPEIKSLFRARNSRVEIEEGYLPMSNMIFNRKYSTGLLRNEVTHLVTGIGTSVVQDYKCPLLTDRTAAVTAVEPAAAFSNEEMTELGPINQDIYDSKKPTGSIFEPLDPVYSDTNITMYPLVNSFGPIRLGRPFELDVFSTGINTYMNSHKVVTTDTAWPIYDDQVGSWTNDYIVATVGSVVPTKIRDAAAPSARAEAREKKANNPFTKGHSNGGGDKTAKKSQSKSSNVKEEEENKSKDEDLAEQVSDMDDQKQSSSAVEKTSDPSTEETNGGSDQK